MSQPASRIRLFMQLGMVLLALHAGAAFADVAGHVQFVNGDVQVLDSLGRVHALKKGEAVNEGDTLTTAKAASAQIRMQDGGFIEVRADTRMKFDQFKFSGKADGTEKNYFSLLKGAFRAVTGLIGQINRDNYRVTTPTATIGIRGTDFETVVVEAPRADLAMAAFPWLLTQADVPAPIIGGGFAAAIVNKGAIEMGTDRGRTLLQPGQGMVVSYGMNQLPVIKPLDINLFPGAGKDKPSGQGGGKGGSGDKGGSGSGSGGSGSGGSGSGDKGGSGGSQQGNGGTQQPSGSNPVRDSTVVDNTLTTGALTGTGTTGLNPGGTGGQPTINTVTTTPGSPVITQTITVVNPTGSSLNLSATTPSLATCTAAPATAGCAAVLPTLAMCTANSALAGCTAVLPTLAMCTANSALAGCTAVLPTLAMCTANSALAGCTAVLPSLATCTVTPAAAGCSAVLPSLAACISTPSAAGCSAVLPNLATCTVTPSAAGCSAVLPSLAACNATPSAAGCSAVLPSLTTCTATPSAAGCGAVLPSLTTCTATPSAAGCSAVLPSLATCTAIPSTTGCGAVLPSLATCTSTPTVAGCSAVLPSLAICTVTPTAAGCSAVLPSLATCTTAPTAAGCSAVLPTLATCTSTPTAAGCSAVLPSLATCTSTPTAAGCSAVLPSLATCTSTPTAAGCSAVLPSLATCTTTPTAAGCSAVLPSLATCTSTPTAAGCSAVLPSLATCTTTPTAAGCSAVLPSLATCTATPTTAGCSAVLPSLATCTSTPTAAGCSAVLPSLATCTTTPTATGCSAVLPSLTICTTTPATAGCSAVLPSLATCTATPTVVGCSAVLPTLATCAATPTAAGCSAVLPSLATCTANPAATGCSAVLPNLATCTATPTAEGCSAVLPSLATCIATPAAAGCSAVLPSLATCTVTPTAEGCTLVLPSLATCTATPTAAGCSAVLPSLATCTVNPTAEGCSAVLPSLATCIATPTAAGCSAVLPNLANCTSTPSAAGCSSIVQPFVQTDIAFETSVSNKNGATMSLGSNLSAAANFTPGANPPSFIRSYGCIDCGTDAVQFPGATGAVNGNATSFATTGIQFGRWTNVPSIAQASSTIPFGSGNNVGFGSSSWIYAPEGYLDTPTTLSAATGGTNATGVFNYALNSGGAPAPQDQNGAKGSLTALTLAADFTAQTVAAALTASMGATTWSASSTAAMRIGAFNGTGAGFSGGLSVTSSNGNVNTYGYLSGAFTAQNYAGAIVDYIIQEWPLAGGVLTNNVTGVAGLTRNGVLGNHPVTDATVPATGKFVVAEATQYGMTNLQTVDTVTANAGVLTGYATNLGAGNASGTTIACTTCTGQAAADPLTGIQFGTWDTGTRSQSYTQPFGGQVHWIKGPGPDPYYLPGVLLGTMTYNLDGGTAPTNQNGLTGTLSSASLTANFTNQTVDISLGLNGVNGHDWTASSTGTPLTWTSYSKNGFRTDVGAAQGALSVVMNSGTPMAGTGNISGQLTGSGLNGALLQYQLSASLPLPTVPTTLASNDMATSQAPSVTVTGPVGTGQPVSVAFPAGTNGTLAAMPATTLTATLTEGLPSSAALTGGVATTVAALSPDPSRVGTFVGTATLGETLTLDTYAADIGLKYANFGEWRMAPTPAGLAPATATGPFTIGEFAGGMLLTPVASMPLGNVGIGAYYSGMLMGGVQDSATNTPYSLNFGVVDLNANFSANTLTGTANYIQVQNRVTGTNVGYFNDLTLATTIATNAFSGSVTAGAVPAGTTASPVNIPANTAGATSGHFYGPNANELAGIWQLVSGTIKAAGAFGASNGTSDVAPLESVSGTVALAATTPANTATPYRMVAISSYAPSVVTTGGMLVSSADNNATRVTADVAGNLTAFDAAYNSGINYSGNNSLAFAAGTATPADFGTDPLTGISWGRWAGGTMNVIDRTTGQASNVGGALGSSSLHWIAGPTMTAPVTLPTTGTYNYVLAGGTAPTDNLGNVGTLNNATLTANFTAQTVAVGVNVGITNASGAATYNASGAGIPIQQRSTFQAATVAVPGMSNALTATCSGAGCGVPAVQAAIQGKFSGATGNGVGMSYGFSSGANVVNGVAAFQRNGSGNGGGAVAAFHR